VSLELGRGTWRRAKRQTGGDAPKRNESREMRMYQPQQALLLGCKKAMSLTLSAIKQSSPSGKTHFNPTS